MEAEQSAEQRGPAEPLSEEQIIAATLGPPQLLNGTITLVAYNPTWPSLFAQLAQEIREVLGERVLLLEHVGSTSVPGLSAKPIIDMVLTVADSRDEASYVAPLEAQGYTLRIREPDWYQHRLLRPPQIAGNLHVFSDGCEEVAQMLRFRDWLRTHPEDRLHYEQTKHELAARTSTYQLFVGVDIAAASFAASWTGTTLTRTRAHSLAQTPEGFTAFQTALTATGVASSHTLVALEATGGYWITLAVTLHQAGYAVSLLNPAHVHAFARSLPRRAKTDALEAQLLAQFAAERQPPR